MLKIPHHKYLLTLIIGKMANQEIFKDLKANSLTAPPISDLEEIREQIFLGQDNYLSTDTQPELSWLKELGIEAMYGYKFKKEVVESLVGIAGALKVINDPSLYSIITALGMSGVPPEDIELIINSKYDIEYSSRDLDIFLHYFFDLKGWSRFEKESYTANIKDPTLKYYYKLAIDGDLNFLLWKLGIAPNKSFEAMLRDMVVDSYYQFKEQQSRDPDLSQKWGSLVLKTHERLDKVAKELNSEASAKEDLQDIFTQFITKGPGAKKSKPKPSGPFVDMEQDLSLEKQVNATGKEIPLIKKLHELN